MSPSKWIVLALAVVGLGVGTIIVLTTRPGTSDPGDAVSAGDDPVAASSVGASADRTGADDDPPGMAAAMAVADPQPAGPTSSIEPKPPAVEPEEERQMTMTDGVLELGQLIEHAEHLDGQEVTVEGVILTQCIVGCRFTIEDPTGVANIELDGEALENTLAGGSVGRLVRVRGTIRLAPNPVLMVTDPDGWEYVR
jgi:hypothetical protein